MKQIITGQTRSDAKRKLTVLVDDKDYEFLNQFHWQADKNNAVKGRVFGKQILMHRFIMQVADNVEVDHVDRNPLNNQRSNLRVATSSQNKCNRGPRKDNTSGFKGVSWHSQRNKWTARIKVPHGKYLHLGLYTRKVDAVRAYDKASQQHHGDFAFTNRT
jgi:hypothetical protein